MYVCMAPKSLYKTYKHLLVHLADSESNCQQPRLAPAVSVGLPVQFGNQSPPDGKPKKPAGKKSTFSAHIDINPDLLLSHKTQQTHM